jgi:two-component system response regulator NreC
VEFSDIPLEDGIRSLRQVCPEAVFAFLTHWDQDRFVRLALEHKVAGYLLKTESLETLVEGIGRLSRGQRVFSAEIETRLARVNGDLQLVKPRCPAFATLTQRELELLRHLSLGASLKEAAAVMNVSYKTADNQKANLMRKLGIHDRVELARFAIRERLVRADTGFDYPAVIRGRSTETKTAGPRPFAVAQ